MKFVHHFTGEWVRPNSWTTAMRYPSDAYVREYSSIDEIENDYTRQTFTWMLEAGEMVTQCGSNIFQIRKG